MRSTSVSLGSPLYLPSHIDAQATEDRKEVRIRAKDREQMFIKHPLLTAFSRSFPSLEASEE